MGLLIEIGITLWGLGGSGVGCVGASGCLPIFPLLSSFAFLGISYLSLSVFLFSLEF